MQQFLLIIQVIVAVGLVSLVLLQQGRGADAGAAFGGGGAGSVFGSRGPATLLTRLTAIFAAVFFVNSIGLAYVAKENARETRSVVERYEQGTQIPASGTLGEETPTLPGIATDVPALPDSGDEN